MKQFLILCLSIVFAMPLLASGIDANATDASCDNTTLETYSGTANVEINWIPNTIQTRWYDGNTLIDTTNTDATSCVYDDVLNRPTNPTRTGYTFTGWTMRPEIDFATTIPLDVNGNERFAKRVGNRDNICKYYIKTSNGSAVAVSCDSDDFKELRGYEWKVKFNHGTLYGMARCSITSGEFGQIGNPVIESGEYCWCKATGYRTINSDIINAPSSTLPWVFYSSGSCAVGEAGCRSDCANVCGNSAFVSRSFRVTLFTPAN